MPYRYCHTDEDSVPTEIAQFAQRLRAMRNEIECPTDQSAFDTGMRAIRDNIEPSPMRDALNTALDDIRDDDECESAPSHYAREAHEATCFACNPRERVAFFDAGAK